MGESRPSSRDGKTIRKRGFTSTWRTGATLAGKPHGAVGRGDLRSYREPLRPGRISQALGPPFLVSVLWGPHGHGLAFVRDHNKRHRCLEARADPSWQRAWHLCVRGTGQTFA